jgi:hypothetical protein
MEPHDLAVLTKALEAWDRAEQARTRIDADGLMVTSRLGEQKPHPLLGIERDSRTAFLARMRQLNLDYEPIAHHEQTAAARAARWRNQHDSNAPSDARPVAALAGRERWYLRYGHFMGGDEEDPDSFIYRDEDGQWTVDKVAAREVWEEHRAELIADAAHRGGLIPWAAREFDGTPGKVSYYEDLRIDGTRTAVPSYRGHPVQGKSLMTAINGDEGTRRIPPRPSD